MLLISISLPNRLTPPHAWALNLLPCGLPSLQAVTVYSLYTADMERVYLRLRATFRNSLRLPISPFSSSTCQAFSDVGYRGDRGEVEIEVLEGAHRSQH